MGWYDDHDPEADEVEEAPQPAPRRRGRPKGSKNRAPESLLTVDKLNSLYKRVKPYLAEDQRQYIEGVVAGTQIVDPIIEMELLIRQMSLLFAEASIVMFDRKEVTQDIAAFANGLRMGIKDLYDIKEKERKRAEEAAKLKEAENADGHMVRITERGSALARLEDILGEGSPE